MCTPSPPHPAPVQAGKLEATVAENACELKRLTDALAAEKAAATHSTQVADGVCKQVQPAVNGHWPKWTCCTESQARGGRRPSPAHPCACVYVAAAPKGAENRRFQLLQKGVHSIGHVTRVRCAGRVTAMWAQNSKGRARALAACGNVQCAPVSECGRPLCALVDCKSLRLMRCVSVASGCR